MSTLKNLFSSLTRVEHIFLVVAGLGLLSGLGCYAAFRIIDRGEAVPAAGGAWREAIVGQLAYVNPVLAKSPADVALTHLLFAKVADLADTVETGNDGKTIRIHLREGLLWSDGRELGSDDVIFTIETIQDPDARSPLFADWQSVKAERVSQLELELSLPVTHAGFAETAKSLAVAPKHIFGEVPVGNWKLSEYMMTPVASGPYVLASRRIERDGFITSVELRANPRFALTGPSDALPYIPKLTVRFGARPEDAIALFNSGAVDGLAVANEGALDSLQRPYQLIRYQTPTVYGIFWNQNANPVLAEGAVREAIHVATERRVPGPLPPSFGASETITPFSLEEARAKLEAAGWKMNDDGVLEKKVRGETRELAFTLLVPDVAPLPDTANALRAEWLAIGINARIERVPLEDLRNGTLKNRTYEAVLFGNTFDPSGDLYPFWHSLQKFHPGLNLALYGDKSVDRLLEEARGVPDPAERALKRDEAARKIMETHPALFLFSEEHLYVAKKELKGAGGAITTTAADRFAETSRWYLRTTR